MFCRESVIEMLCWEDSERQPGSSEGQELQTDALSSLLTALTAVYKRCPKLGADPDLRWVCGVEFRSGLLMHGPSRHHHDDGHTNPIKGDMLLLRSFSYIRLPTAVQTGCVSGMSPHVQACWCARWNSSHVARGHFYPVTPGNGWGRCMRWHSHSASVEAHPLLLAFASVCSRRRQ